MHPCSITTLVLRAWLVSLLPSAIALSCEHRRQIARNLCLHILLCIAAYASAGTQLFGKLSRPFRSFITAAGSGSRGNCLTAGKITILPIGGSRASSSFAKLECGERVLNGERVGVLYRAEVIVVGWAECMGSSIICGMSDSIVSWM